MPAVQVDEIHDPEHHPDSHHRPGQGDRVGQLGYELERGDACGREKHRDEHQDPEDGDDGVHHDVGVLPLEAPVVSDAGDQDDDVAVSYTHLRAHETRHDLVCRLL